ncbi:DeoR/GlpR family DNA-binding transcription regulator [Paenibacillus sp. GCM10023252]|uniref:DeoR/GlpR family DNA-binding transcription regulator n=1 Tax=Paenibacillus sp. GCM10023252 TaxID=3252649 RepID=UPI00361ED1B4
MLAIDRHRRVIEQLEEKGSIKVSELSEQFGVTEKTIREDLERLEEKGLLKRIHGGAILVQEGENSLLPLQLPNSKYPDAKSAIADYAASCIEENDIIALDAGSTTLEIAKRLKNMPLTVLTNDLLIIRELTSKEQIRLVVPGGYRQHNLLVGTEAHDWIRKLNVHKLFLSTTGIHLEYGLTIFNEDSLELKKVYMACAKKIYCVADHSKFDRGALLTFAELGEVDTFITDAALPADTVKRYEEQGAKMVIAGAAERMR